ncbi:hypothetical protein JGU71_06810 [Antrihabitans sp. YC3-6]|uniref:Uncharacterized protein n=1 Tax=Antrihabitans stalagmiti TaxID=2799499 RepID=A0A934NNR4_9NOCA|nr:hypothetical protein [Antrihabitans stalagmiti]MBJ8338589.1 hypothetical protein [Antrihabitans stalagmiti]
MSTAVSKSGAISLRTTEQGLPISVAIERSELRRDPVALAQEILRLCKQSANRAGLLRREELVSAGIAKDVLDQMGLPKPEDVALDEAVDEWENDVEPQSWMRSV